MTLEVKDWVKDSLLFRHFIRGYFDGDGTVGIIRNTNGKSNKEYYRTQIRLCSASEKILLQIQDFLVLEYGLNRNNLIREKDNTFFRIRYIGKQADKFYDIIYEGASIFLKRKFIRYSNIRTLDNSERATYYGKGKIQMEKLNHKLL